jgi:hypothetical protein
MLKKYKKTLLTRINFIISNIYHRKYHFIIESQFNGFRLEGKKVIKLFQSVLWRLLVAIWYCGCGWGSPVATDIVIWLSKKHNFITGMTHHKLWLCHRFTKAQFCRFLCGGITEQCSHAPLFTWTVEHALTK